VDFDLGTRAGKSLDSSDNHLKSESVIDGFKRHRSERLLFFVTSASTAPGQPQLDLGKGSLSF
jgi:hypothetical protein